MKNDKINAEVNYQKKIHVDVVYQKKQNQKIRNFIIRNKDIIAIIISMFSLLVTILIAIKISSQQVQISKRQADLSEQNLKLSKQNSETNKLNSSLAFHFDIDNSELTKETYEFMDVNGEIVTIESPIIKIMVDQGAMNKVTGIKMDEKGVVSATVVLTAKDFIDKNFVEWFPSMLGQSTANSLENSITETFMAYDYYFILAEDFNSNTELVLISYDIDLKQKKCAVNQYYYEETLMLENQEWVDNEDNWPRIEQFKNFRKLQKMLQDGGL